MKVERGLYTDCSETDQPEGTYRFAMNVVDSNLHGAKENEDGFALLDIDIPHTVIGTIPISETETVVFSTLNQRQLDGSLFSVESIVGLVDLEAGTYTEIYDDPEMRFLTTAPIKGEFRKDVTGERIVTWIDGVNPPRILNIDTDTPPNDVEDLALFQNSINPSISASAIIDFGGSLKTGAITPITKYKNRDGSETNWFVHDHTFYINDDAKSLAFNLNDGAEAGTITNKSVTFTLAGCDTRFDTIVVGYIQVVNNITTAKEAFSTTNSSTVTVTLTGAETSSDISLDEVLVPTTTYTTAKAITQLSGQLYLGNLTAEALPELQQAALKVRIDYNHSLMNVISNTNSHKDNIPPSFMPGEVYAFYLGVELVSGGWALYHIPGRAPVSNDTDTIVDSNTGLTFKNYQVGDTDQRGFLGAATNMGYWENENETYPQATQYNSASIGGPDLRGQKVRHHRFPTLGRLVSSYYSGDSNVGITTLVRLGISVTNVAIPTALQSKIRRWKIFFAKKTDVNSIVIGSDLYQAGMGTQDDASLRWATGGNWAIDADQDGSDDWRDFNTPIFDNVRGHSLDFMFNPPSAAPTYAMFHYQLKREGINNQYSGFRSPGARLTISGEDYGQLASVVVDFTVPSQTVRSGGSGFRKRLDNFTFLPQNALNGRHKSHYNEPSFVADIHNPSTDFDVLTKLILATRSSGMDAVGEQFSRISGGTTSVGESTFYMQYFRLLTNAHVSFTQQEAIPVEGYGSPATSSGTFYGGDTFMCYLSYLATGPLMANPDSQDGAPYEHGVRAWKAYIGYSRYNFNYRHQIQGNIGTYYHGKTDVRTLFTPTVDIINRNYSTLIRTDQGIGAVYYDTSLNSLNNYNPSIIFNNDIIQATEFPNTVIWSPTQSEESKEFSWRSFPAGNRYTITKNKGDIANIQGVKGKELLIHTTNALFRTRTDANVQAEGENIFFKSANLFDLPPEEMVSTTSGYAGTQNKFACVLTKVGYIYPDDKQGKIFLYDGDTLDEISSNGMRIFFRDSMKIGADNTDNPFTREGYNIAYDEKYNRLIVIKRTDTASWAASYNPIKKCWVSFHSYRPNFMFNMIGGELYSFFNNSIYKHNAGPKGSFIDPDEVEPSYVDLTFGIDKRDKEFTGVSWLTELYPNEYVLGQPNTRLQYAETCTHLTVRSPEHTTGKVTVRPLVGLDNFLEHNTRNLNRTWYFDDIRDISIDNSFLLDFYSNYDLDTTKLDTNTEWFERRRFIDKTLTCRFEYDNLSNRRFILLEADAQYKYVQR